MAKLVKNKKQQKNAGLEITGQLLEYVLAAVLMALCIAVPFYAKEGYYQIGNAKFAAYKYTMIAGFAILLLMLLVYLGFYIADIRAKKKKNTFEKIELKKLLSVTDWCVIAYFICVIFSVIAGGYYENALWGYPGWNMGFMSQLSFVLLYFFISRFGKYHKAVLTVLCSSSALVFIFGILHRLLIDPLGYYENIADYYKAQFLSTLGQATWYASFMIVVLPIGISLFLYAKNKFVIALSVCYVFIGFCTLVTQNSDSAYFALVAFMLVFFWGCVEEREKLLRFFIIVTMFFLAGKFMNYLLVLKPNPTIVFDFVTQLVLSSKLTWVLLVLSLAVCIVLAVVLKDKKWPVELMKKLRLIILGFVIFCVVCAVILIICNKKGVLPQSLTEKLSTISYMTWDENWGNGRGRTWSFTADMFKEENLFHKLFGVGPDCYNYYASAHYSDRLSQMWGNNALTNAHNEWFNMLINAGITGLISYAAIFITMAKRSIKKGKNNLVLTAVSACIASYMAYNFFCYQQVLCTPFIFVLIGIGEYQLLGREA